MAGIHRRNTPPRPSGDSSPIEAEVDANVLAQRAGLGHVGDLDLPASLLRCVRDRIIRASFYERSRLVSDAGPGPVEEPPRPPAPQTPPLRAFRRPSMGAGPDVLVIPQDGSPAHRAAAIIAQNLASRGLLATAHLALRELGSPVTPSEAVSALWASGFPVDLLDAFWLEGRRGADLLADIAQLALRGGAPNWARFDFRPRPAAPGFVVHPDDGAGAPGLLRFQMPRGDAFLGTDDGGPVDLLGQACAALPGVPLLISCHHQHADALRRSLAVIPSLVGRNVTLREEGSPISQWACDNAKAGDLDGSRAWLLPRYADTGEEVSKHHEGDSLAGDALALAGERVVRTPLLFQGGNILVSRSRDGSLLALVGEAEVQRNHALGLSPAQALEWLRVELGVDRCVVLPAISYHVDYEVSVRVDGLPRPTAFVNDTGAAARLIASAGLDAMHASTLLDDAEHARLSSCLRHGRLRDVVAGAWACVRPLEAGDGVFDARLAQAFATGPTDPGAPNARLFLLALDLLTSECAVPREFAHAPHFEAVLRSWERRREDRRRLRVQLESLGFSVVPVPSLAEGAFGPNTINGVHAPGLYLMPAHGGLYRDLDNAAAEVFARAMGTRVSVCPIRSRESLRREGGVRCSMAVALLRQGE